MVMPRTQKMDSGEDTSRVRRYLLTRDSFSKSLGPSISQQSYAHDKLSLSQSAQLRLLSEVTE